MPRGKDSRLTSREARLILDRQNPALHQLTYCFLKLERHCQTHREEAAKDSGVVPAASSQCRIQQLVPGGVVSRREKQREKITRVERAVRPPVPCHECGPQTQGKDQVGQGNHCSLGRAPFSLLFLGEDSHWTECDSSI